MPDLKLWSEKELDRLKQDMDRLFEGFYLDLGLPSFPARGSGIEIRDTGEALRVLVPVPPGTTARDMELTVFEEGLRLSVVRLANAHGRASRTGVTRTLSLPCRVDPDRARAELSQGTLIIDLPKCGRSRRKTVHITES